MPALVLRLPTWGAVKSSVHTDYSVSTNWNPNENIERNIQVGSAAALNYLTGSAQSMDITMWWWYFNFDAMIIS